MREFKYVLLCILLFSSTLFAHDGGHGEPLKKWTIKSSNEVIIADFIKYENDEVWLVDDNHAIHILDMQEFNLADQ
ncbi:hypothetical protein, partial [Maribacter sp.]|uniref:hypothetical protein n=1 Tax=Maribacter sp. TaxID=1897614 RepID=UPI0032991AD2